MAHSLGTQGSTATWDSGQLCQLSSGSVLTAWVFNGESCQHWQEWWRLLFSFSLWEKVTPRGWGDIGKMLSMQDSQFLCSAGFLQLPYCNPLYFYRYAVVYSLFLLFLWRGWALEPPRLPFVGHSPLLFSILNFLISVLIFIISFLYLLWVYFSLFFLISCVRNLDYWFENFPHF